MFTTLQETVSANQGRCASAPFENQQARINGQNDTISSFFQRQTRQNTPSLHMPKALHATSEDHTFDLVRLMLSDVVKSHTDAASTTAAVPKEFGIPPYDPVSHETFRKYLLRVIGDIHKEAESDPFIQKLMKGEVEVTTQEGRQEYSGHIMIVFCEYACLEKLAQESSSLPPAAKAFMIDAARRQALEEDYRNLMSGDEIPHKQTLLASPGLTGYIDYLDTIKHDPVKLLAHIYCRCGADLAGGQIMHRILQRKHWPASTLNYFNFGDGETVARLKKTLHELIENIPKQHPESIRVFTIELIKAFQATIAFNQEYSSSLRTQRSE